MGERRDGLSEAKFSLTDVVNPADTPFCPRFSAAFVADQHALSSFDGCQAAKCNSVRPRFASHLSRERLVRNRQE